MIRCRETAGGTTFLLGWMLLGVSVRTQRKLCCAQRTAAFLLTSTATDVSPNILHFPFDSLNDLALSLCRAKQPRKSKCTCFSACGADFHYICFPFFKEKQYIDIIYIYNKNKK